MVKSKIKKLIAKILNHFGLFVLPGHFYSPIPSKKEIRQHEEAIWPSQLPNTLPGLTLNTEPQIRLMQRFKPYYATLPFTANKTEQLRYYFKNPNYPYSDAIILHCIMREFKPKRIIEIGCGFSSCVMMDTNEFFFNNTIEIKFIEPHPELLFSLMKAKDKEGFRVLNKRIQNCELSEFSGLEENDILFIDSSHVAKVNSDVNFIIFNILPSLNKGVLVHIHDIFYPFEYPLKWFYQGRAWNEAYFLRAFLQYNTSFEIIFFNTYLEHFSKEEFKKEMPLCLENRGASIWLKKIS